MSSVPPPEAAAGAHERTAGLIPAGINPAARLGARRVGALTAFAVAALGVAGFYAIYTDHAWEDFFITFRFSRNLVEGKGLVYQPGERVHGFT